MYLNPSSSKFFDYKAKELGIKLEQAATWHQFNTFLFLQEKSTIWRQFSEAAILAGAPMQNEILELS